MGFFAEPNKMSLVVPEKFQHILRVLNTNIDGRIKIMYALTAIKGVGRRYANICLRKADITGACVCEVNTPRLPAEEVAPLVCPRRSRFLKYFHHITQTLPFFV